MPTIKDVAKAAGVSVATVSRVINNESNVLQATREQVLASIQALNYSPNLLGRNLRRNETRKILVLLNTISNQFYAQVVRGIEQCAMSQDYIVMISMTHGDVSLEEKALSLLKNHLVDGAIFLTSEQDGEKLTRELSGNKIVQACEPKSSFLTPSVSIDNLLAAREATEYLLKKGHRKIAFFGAGKVYESSHLREKGYCQAMSTANAEIRKEWILDEGFSVNAGIRAAKKLLLQKEALPTAIFCVSDSAAVGAIRTLTQNKIRVPQDISVMGFDNTQLSQIYLPAITTTRQPQYEIGYQAMELLLHQFSGKAIENQKIILSHQIMERDSVLEIGKDATE